MSLGKEAKAIVAKIIFLCKLKAWKGFATIFLLIYRLTHFTGKMRDNKVNGN